MDFSLRPPESPGGRLKGVKKGRRARQPGQAPATDIEAIGLVVVALGLFLAGVLISALPTGELGRTLRAALVGRAGLAAYALPLPPLAIGGLFLLRRNPSWWPRLLLGYVVLIAGAWGLLAAVAPEAAGAWGLNLRASLGRSWGTLAVIPAVVVATLGIDLLVGWTPTTLLRGVMRSVAQAVRGLYRAASGARRHAKERAAFGADAALVRRGMSELGKDLEALSTLYPGSAELERWRTEVRASHRNLRAPSQAVLKEARADLKAWRSAVADFSKDRAAELAVHLDAEAALPPEPDAGGFEQWSLALKQLLDDAIVEKAAAAVAADRLRKALALDLTALIERNRRLTRERDLDRRALKGMSPRELAGASQAHHRRLESLRSLEQEADRLSLDADGLEPWRELLAQLDAVVANYQGSAEVSDYDATLAKELSNEGRQVLGQLHGWREALAAVERRASAAQVAMQAEAAQQAEVAMQAEADQAAQPARAQADEARGTGAWFAGEDANAQDHYGAVFGAAGRERHDQRQHERSLAPALEAALLDDRVAIAEPPAQADDRAGTAVGANLAGSTHAQQVTAVPLRRGSPTPTAKGADEDDRGRGPAVPEVGGIPIQLPPLELLDVTERSPHDREEMLKEHRSRVAQIDETLANFKLGGRVVAAVRGPTVTRFEVEPAPGEKISRFANLSDDLALAMAVGSVRIEAPIPGKSVIGLEVPNAHRELVRFREATESPSYRRAKARLPLILGKSIDGDMMVGDLAKMPHLLIAGSTGSGKSVAVNTLVGSLLYRFLPTELRFLMIDPKMVELTPFDGIPHLLRPVVTNPKDAAGVLLGAVTHMERRYQMMSKLGAKNLDQYNEKARNLDLPPMPFITIIIDELADLMITSPKEVESSIMRLAQMARATGMHLILATQRPSVDILTSLIKVNVPARMAFAVSSSHDSRTILDGMGAERLIGLGDMLFYQPGLVKAVRLQGPFVSENEIARLSDFLRRQYFDDDFVEAYGADFDPPPADDSTASGFIDWNDDKLRVAAELVINEGQASVSRLQRRLSVGHARAGKLMDSLEALGVVGPHTGSKPREVLVPFEELPNIFGK